jgi:hypothetical protein
VNLVVKKLPERFSPMFFTGPSWSPDDKLIAASVMTVGGSTRVAGFSTEDGTERELASQHWQYAARAQWLSDMSGLLVVAGDGFREAQIWYVGYPDGKSAACHK